MPETGYPHGDSTLPHSRNTATTIATKSGRPKQETADRQPLRKNAIACCQLDRYGITS